MDVTLTIEEITPQMANQMLEGNDNNRPPAKSRLETYASDMKTKSDWLAIQIKAANAWLTGRAVKQLSWRRVGSKREPFPRLVSVEEIAGT